MVVFQQNMGDFSLCRERLPILCERILGVCQQLIKQRVCHYELKLGLILKGQVGSIKQ
jgi:hypothetical protein